MALSKLPGGAPTVDNTADFRESKDESLTRHLPWQGDSGESPPGDMRSTY